MAKQAFTQLGSLQALSYSAQLDWLESEIAWVRNRDGGLVSPKLHILLSLTQSVKDARLHNLNCREVK
jgi:hypothetical protein